MSSSLNQTDLEERTCQRGEGTASESRETLVQLDRAVALFTRERPRLLRTAYRIVGNEADAEDVVQDVWMRWQSCDRGSVQAPAALLVTTATRLAINVIQSARARHETNSESRQSCQFDAAADPAIAAEHREALESAVRLLVERLSPAERAAYTLREAFDYPYWRIAEIIQATEATSRQLVSRARKRVGGGPGQPVKALECARFLTPFLTATRTGQFTALEQLLIADVRSRRASRTLRNDRPSSVPGRREIVKLPELSDAA
jgi:RNA polymerase sigma-70 factor (ECF subfamily)